MDIKYAVEILTEVKGTSSRYIKEYGKTLVKEALNYLIQLNRKRKTKNNEWIILTDSVNETLRQ